MEYSGAGGKLIYEKNQKQKISWHCPFKGRPKLGYGRGRGAMRRQLKRGLLPCYIPCTESCILGSAQDEKKRFLGGFLLRTRKKGHTASELGFTT